MGIWRSVVGEENSGLLVSLLRAAGEKRLKRLDLTCPMARSGIGCPVIASLSGVSLAVIVTEPTSPDANDLERWRICAPTSGYRPASLLINGPE
ncbi:MAG: hypothetical protein R2874_02990 [Desulfobacterales bacterium]